MFGEDPSLMAERRVGWGGGAGGGTHALEHGWAQPGELVESPGAQELWVPR